MSVNTLRPRQNGRHFANDVFKGIFLNENEWISIIISLKFVPSGLINSIPTVSQTMAWRRIVGLIFTLRDTRMPRFSITTAIPRFKSILWYFYTPAQRRYMIWISLPNYFLKVAFHYISISHWTYEGGCVIHSQENYTHYNDVIMDAMASQITSLAIVYSAV